MLVMQAPSTKASKTGNLPESRECSLQAANNSTPIFYLLCISNNFKHFWKKCLKKFFNHFLKTPKKNSTIFLRNAKNSMKRKSIENICVKDIAACKASVLSSQFLTNPTELTNYIKFYIFQFFQKILWRGPRYIGEDVLPPALDNP